MRQLISPTLVCLLSFFVFPPTAEAAPLRPRPPAAGMLLRAPIKLLPKGAAGLTARARRQGLTRRQDVAPRPQRARRVGWGAGEQLTFAARLAGIEAGRVAVSIGAPRGPQGQQTIRIRGRSEPIPTFSGFYKLQEDLVTTVDLRGVMPLQSRLVTRRGARVTTTTTEHGTTRKTRTRQWVVRSGAKARRPLLRHRGVGRIHYDPLTALLALRSAKLSLGQRFALLLVTGRKTYRISGRVVAKDRRRFAKRSHPCLRIEGSVQRVDDRGRALRGHPGQRLTVWLGSDAGRLPLAAELDMPLGTLQVALTSYRPTRQPLLVRPLALR